MGRLEFLFVVNSVVELTADYFKEFPTLFDEISKQARLEAQSFRLTCEDAPTIDYMARFIAKTQQKYTQRGGVRPFGVSSMIAGFSPLGSPELYLTDPG